MICCYIRLLLPMRLTIFLPLSCTWQKSILVSLGGCRSCRFQLLEPPVFDRFAKGGIQTRFWSVGQPGLTTVPRNSAFGEAWRNMLHRRTAHTLAPSSCMIGVSAHKQQTIGLAEQPYIHHRWTCSMQAVRAAPSSLRAVSAAPLP